MQRKVEDEWLRQKSTYNELIREYTSDNVVPLLKDSNFTRLLAMVPASTRKVFEKFHERPEYSSFFYKAKCASNPTNFKDRVDEFETKLLEHPAPGAELSPALQATRR